MFETHWEIIKMESLAAFNSLLAKNHVTSALLQDEGRHNEVPLVRPENVLFQTWY